MEINTNTTVSILAWLTQENIPVTLHYKMHHYLPAQEEPPVNWLPTRGGVWEINRLHVPTKAWWGTWYLQVLPPQGSFQHIIIAIYAVPDLFIDEEIENELTRIFFYVKGRAFLNDKVTYLFNRFCVLFWLYAGIP